MPGFYSGYSRALITTEVINDTMVSVTIIIKKIEILFLEAAWSSLQGKKELEITPQQQMLCDCTSCIRDFKCKSL